MMDGLVECAACGMKPMTFVEQVRDKNNEWWLHYRCPEDDSHEVYVSLYGVKEI